MMPELKACPEQVKNIELFQKNNDFIRKIGHCDGLITGLLELKNQIADLKRPYVNPRHVRKVAAREAKLMGLERAYERLEKVLRDLQTHLECEGSNALLSKATEVFIHAHLPYLKKSTRPDGGDSLREALQNARGTLNYIAVQGKLNQPQFNLVAKDNALMAIKKIDEVLNG